MGTFKHSKRVIPMVKVIGKEKKMNLKDWRDGNIIVVGSWSKVVRGGWDMEMVQEKWNVL